MIHSRVKRLRVHTPEHLKAAEMDTKRKEDHLAVERRLHIILAWLFVYGAVSAETARDRCSKCYHPVYLGMTRGYLLRIHSRLNPMCINLGKVSICEENGKTYWQAENVGSVETKISGECPVKEPWMCTDNNPRNPTTGKMDTIREREVEGHVKTGITQMDWEGRNLFMDMVERISHELNVTNCWVCGGTKNTEGWPWEGTALTAAEIIKVTTEQGGKSPTDVPRDYGETWYLQNKVIGEDCLWRKGLLFFGNVGEMPCQRYKIVENLNIRWLPKAPFFVLV